MGAGNTGKIKLIVRKENDPMEEIIVTVMDERNNFNYDVEVPVNLSGGKLLDDMVEALNGYNPSLYLNAPRLELVSLRKNQVISFNQTLEECGIWNGDYILLRKRGEVNGNNYFG